MWPGAAKGSPGTGRERRRAAPETAAAAASSSRASAPPKHFVCAPLHNPGTSMASAQFQHSTPHPPHQAAVMLLLQAAGAAGAAIAAFAQRCSLLRRRPATRRPLRQSRASLLDTQRAPSESRAPANHGPPTCRLGHRKLKRHALLHTQCPCPRSRIPTGGGTLPGEQPAPQTVLGRPHRSSGGGRSTGQHPHTEMCTHAGTLEKCRAMDSLIERDDGVCRCRLVKSAIQQSAQAEGAFIA